MYGKIVGEDICSVGVFYPLNHARFTYEGDGHFCTSWGKLKHAEYKLFSLAFI